MYYTGNQLLRKLVFEVFPVQVIHHTLPGKENLNIGGKPDVFFLAHDYPDEYQAKQSNIQITLPYELNRLQCLRKTVVTINKNGFDSLQIFNYFILQIIWLFNTHKTILIK